MDENPMQKPLIIVAGHREAHSKYSPIYGEKQAYIQSIVQAGGLPLIVAPNLPVDDLQRLISLADGFLLCGGGDVEPFRYGGEACARLTGLDPERDMFELQLLQDILQADKPLLAICRGVQILNVALGGTLICDIASQLPQAGKHDYSPGYKRDLVVHDVSIQTNTLLAGALGVKIVGTNSLHHQALDKVGHGLVVNARADDGVVEGVEMPSKRFVLGIQWHPECMPESAVMQHLFQTFVINCRAKVRH
jgi:putative glutamine amidotransferase